MSDSFLFSRSYTFSWKQKDIYFGPLCPHTSIPKKWVNILEPLFTNAKQCLPFTFLIDSSSVGPRHSVWNKNIFIFEHYALIQAIPKSGWIFWSHCIQPLNGFFLSHFWWIPVQRALVIQLEAKKYIFLTIMSSYTHKHKVGECIVWSYCIQSLNGVCISHFSWIHVQRVIVIQLETEKKIFVTIMSSYKQ